MTTNNPRKFAHILAIAVYGSEDRWNVRVNGQIVDTFRGRSNLESGIGLIKRSLEAAGHSVQVDC